MVRTIRRAICTEGSLQQQEQQRHHNSRLSSLLPAAAAAARVRLVAGHWGDVTEQDQGSSPRHLDVTTAVTPPRCPHPLLTH